MKSNPQTNLLLSFLALVLCINFWILGYYHTAYALGIFLLVPFFVFSLLIGGISYYSNSKSYPKAVQRFYFSFIPLLIIGSILMKNDKYKPARFLIIPADYSGTIYLFPSTQETDAHVQVDENGMAYINLKPGLDFRIKQGWRDISLAYRKAFNYDVVIDSSETTEKIVDIICFTVEPGKRYPNTYGPYYYDPCLDGETFWKWAEEGLIDPSRIVVKTQPKKAN
jgi:hypothetical protein